MTITGVRFDQHIPLRLRDGVTTYYDLFRPDAPGKHPCLLMRTPYDKSSYFSRVNSMDAVRAALRGYAVAIQDTRGRLSSEGRFQPFVEAEDGYDTVETLASESWCTGKVGMYGSSYNGVTQWQAAIAGPPSLAGIAPVVTASNYHEGWTWRGGAFELGFALYWTLGPLAGGDWAGISRRQGLPASHAEAMVAALDNLRNLYPRLPLERVPELIPGAADYYFDWLSHPEYDAFWKATAPQESYGKVTVPALNVGGWHDAFVEGTLENFAGMVQQGCTEAARTGQRLIVGPWTHASMAQHYAGEHSFGARSSTLAQDVHGQILRFYDFWLKGMENGLHDDRPVKIFVMGINQWRSEDEWPLKRAQPADLYLHSNGRANTLNGDGALSGDAPGAQPPDAFVYNPLDPVPTRGGALIIDQPVSPSGVFDQRPVEGRADVLVYTSAAMEKDVEVTGLVTLTLFASSSAVDTDFTAKLVDVRPDGYARNLCDGIVRARYRAGGPAKLLTPGEVYEFRIAIGSTSNVFRKGHRIRLEVSSSNFPRFDRNLNTGESIAHGTHLLPALQTIFHDAEYPSRVTLPVVGTT